MALRAPASDETLLRQLHAGDERALDALIARDYASLHRFVRRYVGSPDVADDILQDVFLRLWNTRQRLAIRGSLRAYLYTTARNITLNLLASESARRRREASVTDAAARATDGVADALARSELEAAVWRAVDDLPERCREVFLLCRQHGLSYSEVAAVLGVSLSTVKTQMGRAMATLASRLTPFLTLIFAARH